MNPSIEFVGNLQKVGFGRLRLRTCEESRGSSCRDRIGIASQTPRIPDTPAGTRASKSVTDGVWGSLHNFFRL